MSIGIDRERFVETMKEQAAIGGTEDGGLHRLKRCPTRTGRSGTGSAISSRNSGSTSESTNSEICSGVARASDPDAAPVLIGSHLDSQPYGGSTTGALGVIAPLELFRTLEEEGSRPNTR